MQFKYICSHSKIWDNHHAVEKPRKIITLVNIGCQQFFVVYLLLFLIHEFFFLIFLLFSHELLIRTFRFNVITDIWVYIYCLTIVSFLIHWFCPFPLFLWFKFSFVPLTSWGSYWKCCFSAFHVYLKLYISIQA